MPALRHASLPIMRSRQHCCTPARQCRAASRAAPGQAQLLALVVRGGFLLPDAGLPPRQAPALAPVLRLVLRRSPLLWGCSLWCCPQVLCGLRQVHLLHRLLCWRPRCSLPWTRLEWGCTLWRSLRANDSSFELKRAEAGGHWRAACSCRRVSTQVVSAREICA